MVRESVQITFAHLCVRAHVRDTNRSQSAVRDSRESAIAIFKDRSEGCRTSTETVSATLKSSPLVNSVWKALACAELNDTARPALETIEPLAVVSGCAEHAW